MLDIGFEAKRLAPPFKKLRLLPYSFKGVNGKGVAVRGVLTVLDQRDGKDRHVVIGGDVVEESGECYSVGPGEISGFRIDQPKRGAPTKVSRDIAIFLACRLFMQVINNQGVDKQQPGRSVSALAYEQVLEFGEEKWEGIREISHVSRSVKKGCKAVVDFLENHWLLVYHALEDMEQSHVFVCKQEGVSMTSDKRLRMRGPGFLWRYTNEKAQFVDMDVEFFHDEPGLPVSGNWMRCQINKAEPIFGFS